MGRPAEPVEFQLLSFAAFWVISLIASRTKPRLKQILCFLGSFAILTPMMMSPFHEWLGEYPQVAVLLMIVVVSLFFIAIYKPPKPEETKPGSE